MTHISNFALEKLYQQYELALSNSTSICTGQFSNTMGLPYAHKMVLSMMNKEILQLEDIHMQWRIDTRSFSNTEGVVDDKKSQFDSVLQGLQEKYQKLPLVEQERVQNQILQVLNSPSPLLLEPVVQSRKTCLLKSKKRKNSSSTKRDPSAFEIIEKGRKCSICKVVGHDKRTCSKKDNLASFDALSTEVDDTRTMEIIDLNSMPNEFVSF